MENCLSTFWLTVCPSSQDRDFCLLHPEDPLFQAFSGETLSYKGNEPLYPFFINECAYYEKGIALSLARKRRVMIPAIRVQTEQEQQANEQRFASEEEEWGLTSDYEINFKKKRVFIEISAVWQLGNRTNACVLLRTYTHNIKVYNYYLRQITSGETHSQKHSHTAVLFML